MDSGIVLPCAIAARHPCPGAAAEKPKQLPLPLLGWRFMCESHAEIAEEVKNLASAANNVAGDLEHRVQGTARLHDGLAHSRILCSADPAQAFAGWLARYEAAQAEAV